MRRIWLIFTQATTVALALLFVIATLKPEWLQQRPFSTTVATVPAAQTASTQVRQASVDVPAASASPTGSLREAARRAAPAVVRITASRAPLREERELLRRFLGRHATRRPQVGLGSGVIVSAEGYLLTNNHVISGAEDIEVQLNDGRHARAVLVGTDPDTDLAVLKIDLPDLPVAMLGRLASLAVGDSVLVIGNPFDVGQTVTAGIVSALGRHEMGINTYENFIQTDAAINPGNSGGALVDASGALVGINTAIYSNSGGSLGIGFAIPVDTARQVMTALIHDGHVSRGWIGVQPLELSEEFVESFHLPIHSGVLISGVRRGTPAARAGIKPGDVVTRIAGAPVNSPSELLAAVAALTPKQRAKVSVQRGAQALELELLVAQRPLQPTSADDETE